MNSEANGHGTRRRILSHRGGEKIELENQGTFDELVVDDWLHIEQQDDNAWWLGVGDVRIRVTVSNTEPPTVEVERGAYAPIKGDTRVFSLE